MITLLKKVNRLVIYVFVGAAFVFALLADLLSIGATSAYLSGIAYKTMLAFSIPFAVVLLGLFTKLLVYVSYRIDLAIFSRKSGLLYPFPLLYADFEVVICAFLIPGLLLCGLVRLPVLFFPTLSRILGAVRALVLWGSLILSVVYFLKKYSADYNKKSLAFTLVLIPMVLLAISLGLTLLEVIK